MENNHAEKVAFPSKTHAATGHRRTEPDVSIKDALARFDDCVERMLPDDPALREWAQNYARNHRHRLAGDLEMVRRYAPRGAGILEFGSCPPFLTVALHELGYAVTGLDLAPDRFALPLTERGLSILKVDFETESVPFEDDSFDIILFNEVFEHLRINLIRTMTEVRRVLKAGGTLFLTTPNLRSLRGIWALLRQHTTCHVQPDLYEEYDKLRRYGHMGHVREYTAREMSTFLSKVGLRTRRTLFRDYGPPVRRGVHLTLLSSVERALYFLAPGFRPLFTLVCEKTP